MRRRLFTSALALLSGGASSFAAQQISGTDASVWRDIERRSQGRLGVAVLDTRTGRVEGHRLDEAFPMCSTFKWLLAACVLQRVDDGQERLERRIVFERDALPAYSPTTERHVGGAGLSVAELCEAAITLSDNGAANLLLAAVGGPAAVTAEARRLGDPRTRLDRIEPELNRVPIGDPRDSTTPRATSLALRQATLGTGLSEPARAQLLRWMLATRTGLHRLRAGLPADWRVADKTGSGDDGTTNDVAVVWPSQRAPLIVAAYLTRSTAGDAQREATLAEVGRAVASGR